MDISEKSQLGNMQKSNLTVLRTLMTIIMSSLGNNDVSWVGIAQCFEKCADIARQKAIEEKQLDTRFKKYSWDDWYEHN